MKTLEQVKKEVSEMKTKPKEINGFKPVYVKTEHKKGKISYGVQFWSNFLLRQGYSGNTDRSVSYFVELL